MAKAKTETVRIPPECGGKRADSALSEILPQSRSRIAALIKSGAILMDGRRFKPSVLIGGGETFDIRTEEDRGNPAEPEDIPLDVVFEDDQIVVINKPAGMTVHPGAGRTVSTLANALAHRYRKNLSGIGGSERPGIVHRLDKDTSGIVVVAKNDVCHANLARQFSGRLVSKEYTAIVCGAMKRDSGVFSSPIGRSRGNRKKMSGNNPSKPRDSVTEWETVKRLGDWTLVRVSPRTGRTHQIRVHFSDAGHPIAADSLYSSKSSRALLSSSGLGGVLFRHALHAGRLGFSHPVSGEKVSFSAPLPADMEEAAALLSRKAGG